ATIDTSPLSLHDALPIYSANGKIYVISGFDQNFLETSTTWQYDPVANTWDTTRANMPAPTGGAGYSIVGQNIYLAGTWNNAQGRSEEHTSELQQLAYPVC